MFNTEPEYRILFAQSQSLGQAFEELNNKLLPCYEGDDYLAFTPTQNVVIKEHDDVGVWTVYQQVRVDRNRGGTASEDPLASSLEQR